MSAVVVHRHHAEPIEVGEWTQRRLCRVCAFYGNRVPIQRAGWLRRWRHVGGDVVEVFRCG